jgi:hypothetical protein
MRSRESLSSGDLFRFGLNIFAVRLSAGPARPDAFIGQKPMKLEAVVTCVDYADFLAETLPFNRSLFDRMVIVTAPEDKDTRRVCEYWNVQCVLTDVFETRWHRFNKGKGINVGLRELDKDGWLVHMDADILLPPLTRRLLEAADLDPSFIYGVDRHMVPDARAWRSFLAMPGLQQENAIFVHANRFPVGVRIASAGHGGYVPIGFFQMWHASSGRLTYPEQHSDAGRGDMLFAAQWPRSKRALIPEIIAYHLESEPAPMGANWGGRKTRRFQDESGTAYRS